MHNLHYLLFTELFLLKYFFRFLFSGDFNDLIVLFFIFFNVLINFIVLFRLCQFIFTLIDAFFFKGWRYLWEIFVPVSNLTFFIIIFFLLKELFFSFFIEVNFLQYLFLYVTSILLIFYLFLFYLLLKLFFFFFYKEYYPKIGKDLLPIINYRFIIIIIIVFFFLIIILCIYLYMYLQIFEDLLGFIIFSPDPEEIYLIEFLQKFVPDYEELLNDMKIEQPDDIGMMIEEILNKKNN
jgi:hypothetical protein